MPLRAFFIFSFRDICVCAGFSGQSKFSLVTIFKKCLRLVLDLVQILYSIVLQCVFPVLLFNPHTSDLVWMKTDYNVHVSGVLSQPASFPPPHRRGCCAWLPLAGAWEGQHLPPVPCLWCWGRQLPVATTSWGHGCWPCYFSLFPPEFRFIAITFSENVEAIPEKMKQVHSVIEDLVQCPLEPKKCFCWRKRRLGRRRRRSPFLREEQCLFVCNTAICKKIKLLCKTWRLFYCEISCHALSLF